VNARLAAFRKDMAIGAAWRAVHAIGDSTRIHLTSICSTPERHGQQWEAVIYTPGVALVASPAIHAHAGRSFTAAFGSHLERALDERRTLDRTKQRRRTKGRQTDFGKITPRSMIRRQPSGRIHRHSDRPGPSAGFKNPRRAPASMKLPWTTRHDSRHRLYSAASSGPTDRMAYANQFRCGEHRDSASSRKPCSTQLFSLAWRN